MAFEEITYNTQRACASRLAAKLAAQCTGGQPETVKVHHRLRLHSYIQHHGVPSKPVGGNQQKTPGKV